MRVDELMFQEGASIFYDNAFRSVLEDHMTFLRNHPQTRTLPVDAGKAHKFEFDIFGLLADYGVATHLHWLVMRMNNLTDMTRFNMSYESLLIPDELVVSQIQQSHMTTRRIN
jgi:hypothetical protein